MSCLREKGDQTLPVCVHVPERGSLGTGLQNHDKSSHVEECILESRIGLNVRVSAATSLVPRPHPLTRKGVW